MDPMNRLSLTPTVSRQSQQQDFGKVLKDTIQQAAHASGALLGQMPGGGIISAAVSNVTSLASSQQTAAAATGVTSVGGVSTGGGSATGLALATSPQGVPSELGGMISQMRAEADRSTLMQMQMQQESREYNTVSNVLKVRHDSAKAAINNIR